MNKKEIEELIKFVSKAGVSEVSLEQKDFKITIKNAVREQLVAMAAPVPVSVAAPVAVAAPPVPKAEVPVAPSDDAKYVAIKSPMIGTFYRTPSPDKPNFVNVGDEIKPGQVICIIEAMKLFNEIESEVKGRVVKILVDHATPVEYDQPLFLIEPM
jgi:acetyl-CoA carboxylase biotin carboxyl carrier protein